MAILLITACAWLIIDNINFRSVNFYYPDYRFKQLSHEKRRVHKKVLESDNFSIRLVKEYILGPVNYSLRNCLSEDIRLKKIWNITNKGKEAIVVDFSHELTNYLISHNEDMRWFFTGLVKTLRGNTSIKKLYILMNNRPVNMQIGFYDLNYPIIVQNPKYYNKK